MNLSAIKNVKFSALRTAEDAAQRSAARANSDILFRRVPAPLKAAIVAKVVAPNTLATVQPVAASAQVPATGSIEDVLSVVKAMNDVLA